MGSDASNFFAALGGDYALRVLLSLGRRGGALREGFAGVSEGEGWGGVWGC